MGNKQGTSGKELASKLGELLDKDDCLRLDKRQIDQSVMRAITSSDKLFIGKIKSLSLTQNTLTSLDFDDASGQCAWSSLTSLDVR